MNAFYRPLILVSLVFIAIQPVDSQQIMVIDRASGEPVARVALYNQDRSASTLTNDFGRAELKGFGDGDSIYFQHPSYELSGFLKPELESGNGRVFLEKRNILLEEFVISAYRDRERRAETPYMINVLEPGQIRTSGFQTGADILQATGNVMVQKSQGGGGSPILRGFEANKILLVVDGVRMNNAIYRNGHLQNAITIDNTILERAEVLFGPSSLMYGSDALGGVIHYYTRTPEYNRQDAGIYTQFSSANLGKVLHADFNLGGKRIASMTSFTFRDFGDTHSGRQRPGDLGDWGLLKHYVAQVGGVDSTLANPAPYIQKKTAYRQFDLVSKTRYTPAERIDLILNIQLSTSSNIDRYDQLNDYDGENMNYAEWHYGPQNRLMTAVQGVFKNYNPLYTNGTATIAFQRISEDRITRRFRVDDRLYQEEDVFVYSGNVDFTKVLREGRRLYYGVEITHNDLRSQARYENQMDGSVSPALPRYPGGGSHTSSFALYGSYKMIPSDKIVLNAGLRYQYGMLRSSFTDANLPFEDIRINNGALTGSANLVYTPARTWQFDFILATGFRNPNVDDYGKVRAKGDFVTVPNQDLRHEYSYNAEIGISKNIPGIITLGGSAYFTCLTNAIVRSEHTLNGSDSLLYDGEYYTIITNSNASLATIQGVSLNVNSDLPGNFKFMGTFNFLKGKDITDDVPLGHIAPVFGKFSVSHFFLQSGPKKTSRFTSEAYLYYSGRKNWSDMSPYGEDNQEEAIPDVGYPAWYTLNFRSNCRINERFEIQLAVENIFDRFYKTFASGVGAPGRNFILTLRANFSK